MKRLLKIINIALLALLIFAIGYIIGKQYDFVVDNNNKIVGIQHTASQHKIKKLIGLINNQYIDSVNTDSLVDFAIENMLSKLDPHSSYINQNQIIEIQEEMDGEFVGVGVQFRVYKDTIVVTRILNESPNKKTLKTGDRIIKANQISLLGEGATKASGILKGPINSKIPITLVRNNKIISTKIIRQPIPIQSVVASYMLNNKMGYIKLVRFAEKSAQEFNTAIKKLKQQGMQSLVLDLRSNPGGMMSAAETIADEFLKNKELIVYTQDKNQKKEYTYATNFGSLEQNKVYILINEGSASASEIIAGAIQEHGRGLIVGRRSFGKGLVQKEIGLGDGSKLRLTTAKYYTPSGRSIQKPYTNGNEQQYTNELINRTQNGELLNQDSIYHNKDLRFKSPSGKIVYGGGGIAPDVFVPIDTSAVSYWLYAKKGNLLLQDFTFEYIDKKLNSKTYQTPSEFYLAYDSLNILSSFLNQIAPNHSPLSKQNKNTINNYLKATMAKQLFGDNEFYQIWNQEDVVVKKVLELESQKP